MLETAGTPWLDAGGPLHAVARIATAHPIQVQRLRKIVLLPDQEAFILKRGGHVLAQFLRLL